MNFKNIITTEKELREILGYPNEVVTSKTISYIDSICEDFINKSPFLTIASSDLAGNFDVSPKGDTAGFVNVLNQNTLVIPDRPGNKKGDTLTNIIKNPNVGIIFLIPGIRETLRVNGTAQIITDESILKDLAVKGKLPLFGIAINVKEVFMHCAKCIIRSKLWDRPDNATSIPSLGKVLVSHGKLSVNSDDLDEAIKLDEKTNLY